MMDPQTHTVDANQASDHVMPFVKTVVNWLAAILGLGTLAQVVPVIVGVLSALWIAVQLYGYLWYEIPLKRARLAASRSQKEQS